MVHSTTAMMTVANAEIVLWRVVIVMSVLLLFGGALWCSGRWKVEGRSGVDKRRRREGSRYR